jgi:hypothetical protein
MDDNSISNLTHGNAGGGKKIRFVNLQSSSTEREVQLEPEKVLGVELDSNLHQDEGQNGQQVRTPGQSETGRTGWGRMRAGVDKMVER